MNDNNIYFLVIYLYFYNKKIFSLTIKLNKNYKKI